MELHPHCSPVRARTEALALDIGRLMAAAANHGMDTWQLEDSLYALHELGERVNFLSDQFNRLEQS